MVIVNGEKSICPGCIHSGICSREANQPCVWCNRYVRASDMIEKPKWNKTSEKLPEKQGTYLICTVRGKVISAPYAATFKRFNGYAGKTCTHWMELPEGPYGGDGYGTETG